MCIRDRYRVQRYWINGTSRTAILYFQTCVPNVRTWASIWTNLFLVNTQAGRGGGNLLLKKEDFKKGILQFRSMRTRAELGSVREIKLNSGRLEFVPTGRGGHRDLRLSALLQSFAGRSGGQLATGLRNGQQCTEEKLINIRGTFVCTLRPKSMRWGLIRSDTHFSTNHFSKKRPVIGCCDTTPSEKCQKITFAKVISGSVFSLPDEITLKIVILRHPEQEHEMSR